MITCISSSDPKLVRLVPPQFRYLKPKQLPLSLEESDITKADLPVEETVDLQFWIYKKEGNLYVVKVVAFKFFENGPVKDTEVARIRIPTSILDSNVSETNLLELMLSNLKAYNVRV